MLAVPGSGASSASISAPIRSIVPRSGPKILMPRVVRMPVASISVRFLIGMVQLFT